MPTAKNVRSRLAAIRPLLDSCSLATLRKGQELMGSMVEAKHRSRVLIREHPFERFNGAWVVPKDLRREGVMLYLHGGGYACGEMDYATGFGAMLSDITGMRVFCAAYRLAPEHPYPAAMEDALESYQYLLAKGYDPKNIVLCGESAGGGLCYALCLLLKQKQLPTPGCVVSISPWTDLTASGPSYEENKEKDPSMRIKALDFYANCYTKDREDPLVSPIFGDLTGLPPTIIFVGGDEILLSDAEILHQRLTQSNVTAQLVVKPERWHGYLLYGLPEDKGDLALLNRFLNEHSCRENKIRWLRLDNAAKIYPAARRNNWSNIFRISMTLTERIDKIVMQQALDVTVRRFPSIAARLRRGVFWYYLQPVERAPRLREEGAYPLTRMSREEMRRCAFRVIVYENRVAVEMFHSLTDGTGALVFLKSLVAEYLLQKHGVRVSATQGVVGRLEEPSAAELEDSFQKYGGTVMASRRSNDAWRFQGTPETDGFVNLTCFRLSAGAVYQKAKAEGVSVTTYLCACLMMALQHLQQEWVPNQMRRKSIKVLMPVNLRNLFPSSTLRNFAMYTTPEILPRLGEYSFREICQLVKHRMGLDITPKHMSTMIATNIRAETILAVRVVPLFLKNIIMKAIFDSVGERKSSMSMSNLGRAQVPPEMEPYVKRFDVILGVQATAPYNCGVVSYGDDLCINFVRNVKEAALEQQFYRVLRELGIEAEVQSNGAERS